MSRFWSPIVQRLTPYVPGEQPKIDQLIKLNTNECPYGPSPKVLAAMQAEIGESLRRYPDPEAERLCAAIANYFNDTVNAGLQSDNVFVGNGSDEVLAHTFHGLLQHQQPVLFPDIGYSFYPVYCNLYNIANQPIPLGDDLSIDIGAYGLPNGGVVIANPNAPTGIALDLGAIKSLLNNNTDSVVVIDEAYVDFDADSAVSLIRDYDNLLVVQTLSKSRSLAGLRVGLALGHRDLIDALQRIKNSFNSYPLSRLAISGAVAAVEDRDYFESVRQKVIASRDYLNSELSRLGFRATPSLANFIFVTHPKMTAAEIAKALRHRNILVRYFDRPRIDNYLRISIGTEDECRALVAALAEILA